MTKRQIGFALLALFLLIPLAYGAPKIVGPKGGRVLEGTKPKAEFFIEKDRKVSIIFYDDALKQIVPAGEQVVTAVAEAKDGKKTLEFEKKDGVLVSKTALPEGEGYNIVVQVRDNATAKPKNFRVKLETHNCGGCSRQEYACTCDE